MSSETNAIYGVLAEFTTPEQLANAVQAAVAAGYRRMDAYTPFPMEGLAHEMHRDRSYLPLVFLLGGVIGGSGGYLMQYYAMAIDYPLNIGGRPLQSWPAFVPVTFELTILIAALSGFAALLLSMRLPRPHHPLFSVAGFERASADRFFLCLESRDPRFSPEPARRFLEELRPVRVVEVPA